jgi:hypothetical protein
VVVELEEDKTIELHKPEDMLLEEVELDIDALFVLFFFSFDDLNYKIKI